MKTADKEMKEGRHRKAAWLVFFLAAAVLAAAALLLSGGGKRILSVVKYEGSTSVERKERNIKAFEGMRIESGDTVVTGEKSSITMSLDKDKLVRVAELTRVTFEEIVGGRSGEVTSIHLEKGTIINDIKQKLSDNSTYEISTPNATVSVRGTYFVVYVGQEEGYDGLVTKINVYGGTVKVENGDGEVIILYADKKQKDRTDSVIILPQDNRAIVGRERIVVNEGVDYTGLNADDYERLIEIAGEKESALDKDEIERRLSEWLEEGQKALTDAEALLHLPGEDINTGDSADPPVRTAEEILEGLGVEPLPEKQKESGAGELAGLPDPEGLLLLPEPDYLPVILAGEGSDNMQTGRYDSENQRGDSNSGEGTSKDENVSGGEGNNTGDDDKPGEGNNTGDNDKPGEGDNIGENDKPGEGDNTGDNDKPGEGDNTGENDKPEEGEQPEIDEEKAYAPARLTITNAADIEADIILLEEKITLLKEITTPDKAAELKLYKDAAANAKQLLNGVGEVNRILELINNLPMPSEITSSDKTAIEEARREYDHLLNEELKELIPQRSKDKLEACEKKMSKK